MLLTLYELGSRSHLLAPNLKSGRGNLVEFELQILDAQISLLLLMVGIAILVSPTLVILGR